MSDILVDTHAFIWFVEGNGRLGKEAKERIEKAPHRFLSVASVWEIAVKVSIGKLGMSLPFERLQEILDNNGFGLLPIRLAHTQRLIDLPFHHKDPFDRLLIAQAMVEQLPIITVDAHFAKYPVDIVW